MKENEFGFVHSKLNPIINNYSQINLIEIIHRSEFQDQSSNIIEQINNCKPKFELFIIDFQKNKICQFYIITYDFVIIIIDRQDLQLIGKFIENMINISKNDPGSLYFCNKEAQNNFYSDSQIFKQSYSIQNNVFNDQFTEEIIFFNQEAKSLIAGDKNEWKIIYRSLIGHIIKKSYFQTNSLRKFQNELEKTASEISTFQEDDFICIRKLNYSSGLAEGTSRVYLTFFISNELLYVVKKFDSKNCYEKELFFFKNSKLKHHYQLNFLGTVEFNDKTNGIVLEFIFGKSLLRSVELNLFKTLDEKLVILFEILISIENIHLNGFVYRDLKPDNILIDEKKNAILIDFDQSKKFDFTEEENIMSEDIGSLFFMANEQRRSNKYSFASDVYSVGQIIYFLFTGKLPQIDVKTIEFSDEIKFLKPLYLKCISNLNERPSVLTLIYWLYNIIINDAALFKYMKKIDKYYILSKSIINFYLNYNIFYEYLMFYEFKNDSVSLFYLGNLSYTASKDINKAIDYFTLSAKLNNSDAQLMLGNIYLLGELVDFNINKAIKYFTLSADQNNSEALLKLGNIYQSGKYFEINMNKAIHYYTRSSNLNNAKAQLALGNLYYSGEKIEKDINKSIYYYSLSAEQGNSDAQLYLGIIYYNGKLVKKDINKSIHYFTLSADSNNAEAQEFLGDIYYKGIIVEKNIQKAVHFLTLAADQNNAIAQFKIGSIYFSGEFVPKDIKKGIRYLTLSAKQNNSEAKFLLEIIEKNKDSINDYYQQKQDFKNENKDVSSNYICMASYYYDGRFVPRNVDMTIYYLELASDLNNSDEQFFLGNVYFFNKKDIEKAIHYYTLSANLNNSKAQLYLGNIYKSNEFKKLDIDKAIHFLKLAADQNNSDAQFQLGNIFISGEFVERDVNEALKYLTLSANQNNSDAQFQLGNIYLTEEFVDRDINKALKYLIISANQNNSNSQLILGQIYFTGQFIEKNIDKAVYYLTLSANQNNSEASFWLGIIYLAEDYHKKDVKKAFQYLIQSSNQNNANSQLMLGDIFYNGTYIKKDIFYNGTYIKKDIKKAIYYYELSANQNNSRAQFLLGEIYNSGNFIERDIKKAIYYYELSANQNNLEALFQLGNLFYFELINITKALKYYKLSADLNYSDSQAMLGIIYFFGEHLVKDINKSVYYFNLSANQNHKISQFYLGIIYITGFGDVEKDINKAIHYFTLSSNNTNSYADYFLAIIYYNDNYNEKNIKKAMYYLNRSANLNNSNSQYYLGYLYYVGEYYPRDINKAIHYLTLSANQNDSDAQNLLGRIYFEKKKLGKAIHYFTLSADQNNYDSLYHLGVLYFLGNYIDIDLKKAISYFKKSSNLNDPRAKNFLGIIYKNGNGVPKNISGAIEYLNEGVRIKSDSLSHYNLARIYYFGIDSTEINVNKSIELLEKASNRNLIAADVFLFFIFSEIKNLSKVQYYENRLFCQFKIGFIMNELIIERKEKIFEFFKVCDLIFTSDEHFFINIQYYLDYGCTMSFKRKENDQIKNINNDFYEGFGIQLFSY